MAQSDTKTYDEALYPRPASESDTDSEKSMADSEQSMVDSIEEHTSVNMEEDSGNEKGILDDFTCVICAQALVDPMTLHCGHSFCQLCLAGVWVSKRRAHPLHLQCPVCRQPWKNFPAINIQLRNITERNYPKRVEARRAAMTAEDLALVQQFTAVKQAEYQVNNNRQRIQPEIRRIINTLLVLFVVFIVLLVIVFCLLLWVWAGAGGEFMRKPVGKWSNEDVVQWMEGLGEWAQHNYSIIFRKEKITGPQLLLLNEKALEMLGVRNEFRRQTILQAVQELRVREFSAPRNFPEFKAAHRKQTLLLTLLYKEWPRLTFLYTYYFCYYDVFLPLLKFHFPQAEGGGGPDVQGIWEEAGVGQEQGMQHERENDDAETVVQEEGETEPTLRQLFAFALEVLLIPHYLVAGYAWSWFDLHPWICLTIIIHCCWTTVQEGRTIMAIFGIVKRIKIPDLCKHAVRTGARQFFHFAAFFVIASAIWYITPHFICDILFYLILWHTPYHIVYTTVRKIFGIQRRRLRAGVQIRIN